MTTTSPLIEVDELTARLASDRPPVLADVRWALGQPPQREAFEGAHLPGAQWVDLEATLTAHAGPGGRHPLPDPQVFGEAMRTIGVSTGVAVVAYDAATSMAAARFWWLLADAGHPSVRVLNGGLQAWIAAGLPTESGPGTSVRPGTFVPRPGGRAQTTAEEIARSLGSPTRTSLVDVRAAERYAGTHEPIDSVAGHLPGALNLPVATLLDGSGRFRSPAEIRRALAEVGVEDEPVLYCGSGITASQAALALESAGRSAVLYPGSWSDWITDPLRPVSRASDPRT